MKKVKRLFRDDIEIDQIDSSPFQPRLDFKLEKLKKDIIKDGAILVPLMVRLVGDRYELIDGERRWRVAKELNFKMVVCDVVEATDEQADDWIWDTNESREPYEPKERAFRYKRFRDQNMTLQQIADKHNKPLITIYKYLGIFKLPPKYQELVWDGKIGIEIVSQLLPFLNEEISLKENQITEILERAATEDDFGQKEVKKIIAELNGKTKQEGKKIAETIIDAKIETPEDYEKAARLLKQEAEKKREEALTEEEKAKIKADEQAKEIQQKQKQEETARLKKERDEQLKQEREEEIQKRVDEKARKLKKEELIKDEDFVKEVISEHEKTRQRELASQPKQQIYIPLPQGKYRTITIDPPWPMPKIHRKLRPNQIKLDYPIMSLEEIEALPIPDLAYKDGCHIYLWTTHKFLPTALKILNIWGAEYECQLTWVKNVGITPFSWMYSTEHCLFARIGNLPLMKLGQRLDFRDTVREHSRKPDKFYNLVRDVSPEPRIDMFTREQREGFGQYGNEIDKFNSKQVAVIGR